MRIRRRIAWGLLCVVVLAVTATVTGFYLSNYSAYVVETGSMSPGIKPGDLVIDRPNDGTYRVGDIITFRHGEGPDLVTHRIVKIAADGIHTKGDANRTPDVWTIPDKFVEGIVRWSVPRAGFLVVFLQQPTGFASVGVMIIGLLLLWRLFFPPDKSDQDDGAETESNAGAEPDASGNTVDAESDASANDSKSTYPEPDIPVDSPADSPPGESAPSGRHSAE